MQCLHNSVSVIILSGKDCLPACMHSLRPTMSCIHPGLPTSPSGISPCMASTADFAIGASVSEKRTIQEAVIFDFTQA